MATETYLGIQTGDVVYAVLPMAGIAQGEALVTDDTICVSALTFDRFTGEALPKARGTRQWRLETGAGIEAAYERQEVERELYVALVGGALTVETLRQAVAVVNGKAVIDTDAIVRRLYKLGQEADERDQSPDWTHGYVTAMREAVTVVSTGGEE